VAKDNVNRSHRRGTQQQLELRGAVIVPGNLTDRYDAFWPGTECAIRRSLSFVAPAKREREPHVGADSLLDQPQEVAVDSFGNIYIANTRDGLILKVTP
jgi:hypothetical protein